MLVVTSSYRETSNTNILLPNFFLLGAAKAGTTSLHAYLEQNPQIFLTKLKEPHFFDTDDIYANGLAWYSHEHLAGSEAYPARGEATPILHLPHIVIPRLLETYGEKKGQLRFIVVLRDPVERAWSHYLHRCRSMEETKPFATALALEQKRLAHDSHDWAGYFRDGLYAEQLTCWYQSFGADQFLILLSEDLKHHPQKTVDIVCDFLEVGRSQVADLTHTNVASQPRSRFLLRLVAKPPRFITFFTQLLVSKTNRQKARIALRSILSKPYEGRPELDTELADSLYQQYYPHIQQLEALIGRDLPQWQRAHNNRSPRQLN
ncbi:MAG TPA: sulfotransferase domain-containing protein [Caldilineaceae bacterium]|nr:sulfotransferase domain-containing protein [Caldilineaceae bacterium]